MISIGLPASQRHHRHADMMQNNPAGSLCCRQTGALTAVRLLCCTWWRVHVYTPACPPHTSAVCTSLWCNVQEEQSEVAAAGAERRAALNKGTKAFKHWCVIPESCLTARLHNMLPHAPQNQAPQSLKCHCLLFVRHHPFAYGREGEGHTHCCCCCCYCCAHYCCCCCCCAHCCCCCGGALTLQDGCDRQEGIGHVKACSHRSA